MLFQSCVLSLHITFVFTGCKTETADAGKECPLHKKQHPSSSANCFYFCCIWWVITLFSLTCFYAVNFLQEIQAILATWVGNAATLHRQDLYCYCSSCKSSTGPVYVVLQRLSNIVFVTVILAWLGSWAVTTHWHQQEHQDFNNMLLLCGDYFRLWKAYVHNSIHPPEMEINPLKTVCGCPCDGVIKYGHTCNPLTVLGRSVKLVCTSEFKIQIQNILLSVAIITIRQKFFFAHASSATLTI